MISKIIAKTVAFTTREEGATAIEYGLIAAGIALAIAAAVVAFGDQLTALFTQMSATLASAPN